MSQAFDVEITLQQEPWRGLQGQPRNALDPMWVGEERPVCKADVDDLEWEGETGWWWCKLCGYCSNIQRIQHYKPEDPARYLKASIKLFYEARKRQGLPVAETREQMDHIMGVVLREAAARTPDEFARYIADHIQR